MSSHAIETSPLQGTPPDGGVAPGPDERPSTPGLGFRIRRRLESHAITFVRSARRRVARAVYSMPLFAVRNPRKHIEPCLTQCEPRTSPCTGEDWYIRVWPRERVERTPPIAVDDADAERFRTWSQKYQNGTSCVMPEVFISCHRNALVDTPSSIITNSRGKILYESALSRDDVLEASGALDQVLPRRTRRLAGMHAHLLHPWSGAYYHWVIEVLPKLSLLDRFDETRALPLLVPDNLSAFQSDSLRLAGAEHRCVRLARGRWAVDSLVFPEMLGPTSSPSRHAIDWLKRTFAANCADSGCAGRRLYVTRRDAPNRRIVNEDEIIAYLLPLGFEVVCPGRLSFAEQIAIFSTARVIVAPHGAALTNIVFTPPGALVVELFGDNYVNGCFWAIANLCGHTHAFLSVPTTNINFAVPLERLKLLAARLGHFSLANERGSGRRVRPTAQTSIKP